MRRFFAICLLFLFLLYNAGYYILYVTINNQYENSWREKVEYNLLDKKMLQTRSIPITFAYQPDQEEFQPVLEVVEIEGKVYRILQQRYAKDTLHIVYFNDQAGKQLKNSLRDWVNTLAQKPAPGKNNSVWESLEKNYIPYHLDFTLINKSGASKVYQSFIYSEFIPPFVDTITPPPKA